MVDAVKKHSSAEVVMSLGVPTVLSDDTSGIAAAVEMAKGADEVILAVGTDLSWAHEEHDADNITFTAAQAQLISQVAEAAKKPVVVVTCKSSRSLCVFFQEVSQRRGWTGGRRSSGGIRTALRSWERSGWSASTPRARPVTTALRSTLWWSSAPA